MTLTCGFSQAAMNRLVISTRGCSKWECTEATQMSNPARKSASQSTEPSGPMLSSVPCSSTSPLADRDEHVDDRGRGAQRNVEQHPLAALPVHLDAGRDPLLALGPEP